MSGSGVPQRGDGLIRTLLFISQFCRVCPGVGCSAVGSGAMGRAPIYRVNGKPPPWGQDRLWTLEEDIP
jgi:hypothetical protein